jgi:hypothetical protein
MLLTLLLVVAVAEPLGAQSAPTPPAGAGAATLSVSPAIIDDTVNPGTSLTTQVTLFNVSSVALAIHASVGSLVPDQPVDPSYKQAYDASSWFKLSTPDFLLAPNQHQLEDVTISIPASAEPGGHYATIYFESFSAEQQSDVASTSINPRVGVLSLLTVRGNVDEHAVPNGPIQVQGFQAEAGPTSFSLSLKNDGNVHLLPYGNVVVRNIFGKKVKTLPMPLGTLLPGTTRTYNLSWDHGLRFGLYKASATITIGTQHFKLTPESKRFVLFPLIVAIPVLVLVLLVLLIWVLRRLRIRRRRIRSEIKARHWREKD